MLSKLTVANAAGADIVLHEDTPASKRALVDAKGLVGVGPLRSSKRVRPQAHGSINETTFEEGRSIQLTGEVMSQVSIENALAEFRVISQVLLETLDSGAALMKWTEGATGNKLQQLVKLDSECEPLLHDAAGFLDYAVTLFAEDPHAYTQVQTEATGGTITGSAAENTFVETKRLLVNGLAVDAGHVYWGGNNCIGRAAIGGGTVEPEWIKTTFSPTGIAVNGSNIFWASGAGIGRATIAGGTVENAFVVASHQPLAVAIDAGHIYWTWLEAGTKLRIGRSALAGGTVENEWIASASESVSTAADVTVDASFVYWTTLNGIGRATIAGATIESNWITGASEPSGVDVSATFVYWVNRTGNTVGRAKLAGTEVTQAFISGLSAPFRIVADATHLYWNNLGTGFVGRSANLSGGPSGGAVTVAQAGNRPTPLTFRVHGPITDPSVVRESDGSRISLTGTIGAGNYVEINTADRTVKLNGTGNLLGFVNAANTNWQAFSPLASTKYLLTATSATAAFMDVLYRSAFA